MARRAASIARARSYVVNVSPEAPQENDGTNCGGTPLPNMLLATPTTVPVLNTELMAVFVWSPMVAPTNCEPLSISSPLTIDLDRTIIVL